MPERKGFTNGKPFTLTEKQIKSYWGGHPRGMLHCSLCGRQFQVGDTARWQFTNDVRYSDGGGGNPMMCVNCDGTKEEILAKVKWLRDTVENTIADYREYD